MLASSPSVVSCFYSFSLKNSEMMPAIEQEMTMDITGMGKSSSATIGAEMVTARATVLQRPKIVPMNLISK